MPKVNDVVHLEAKVTFQPVLYIEKPQTRKHAIWEIPREQFPDILFVITRRIGEPLRPLQRRSSKPLLNLRDELPGFWMGK